MLCRGVTSHLPGLAPGAPTLPNGEPAQNIPRGASSRVERGDLAQEEPCCPCPRETLRSLPPHTSRAAAWTDTRPECPVWTETLAEQVAPVRVAPNPPEPHRTEPPRSAKASPGSGLPLVPHDPQFKISYFCSGQSTKGQVVWADGKPRGACEGLEVPSRQAGFISQVDVKVRNRRDTTGNIGGTRSPTWC